MKFSHTRRIAADPAICYATLADVRRWPEWLDTVDSLSLLDGAEALAVGVRARIRQPRLPPATWRVTGVVEGHHFTWESNAPGLRFVGHHVVEPDADGPRITLGIQQQGPLNRLAAALWGKLTAQYVAREGACLEERVTSRTRG